MKNLKKAAIIGLSCAIISTSTVFATSNHSLNNNVKIQIDNEWVEVELNPFIENDRTLVELSKLIEMLDGKIESGLNKEKIKIHTNSIEIELSIGNNSAKLIKNDGGELIEETINIEIAPKLIDGNVYVPLRYITENLKFHVQWDNTLRAVIIRAEGDIIAVERPVEFEIVQRELIEDNELLLNLYNKNYMNKGIYSLIDGEYIYVFVTAGEKPTGGYSLEIDSITEVTPGTAYIHATLNSPEEGSMVTQALTYPNVMVKFNKGNILNIQWDLSGDIQGEEAEKNEVIKFVQSFGEKLKMVSLLAPEDILKETMNEYYGEYVSSKLIEKWLTDPVTAPGKLTSSPWPGRIDVLSVEKVAEKQYEVIGNIVEFTSVEIEDGGIAAKREITLTVNKENDKWVITDAKLGEYEIEDK